MDTDTTNKTISKENPIKKGEESLKKKAKNKSYDLKKSSRWRCRNYRKFAPVAFYFAALSAYRSVLLFGYGKYSYFSESMETFFGRSEWWGEWG